MTKLDEKYATFKEEKEKEIADLRDQLRDLMFYIDAQQTIAKSDNRDEIASGVVTVGEAPTTNKHKSKGKKRQ